MVYYFLLLVAAGQQAVGGAAAVRMDKYILRSKVQCAGARRSHFTIKAC